MGGVVEVFVTTDGDPDETSWEITPSDDSSDVLMSGSGYTQWETTYTETGELSCGSYKFVIKDSYGDGLNGEGNFKVTVNGNIVAEGSEFSSDLTKTFSVDGQDSPTSSAPTTSPVTPPTFSPTAPPTFSCTGVVEVFVTTDGDPDETSWEITPSDDPSDVLMSGSGYTQWETTYTEAGELSCGSYKFVIKDSYGDGLNG